MKNRWLERGVMYGLRLTLCTNEEQFLREHKRLSRVAYDSTERAWCKPGGANVRIMSPKDGSMPAAIVCINVNRDDDVIRSLTILAHEATHVKQSLMRAIGEDKPSDEFEAYTVENICMELFTEFERQWSSLPFTSQE